MPCATAVVAAPLFVAAAPLVVAAAPFALMAAGAAGAATAAVVVTQQTIRLATALGREVEFLAAVQPLARMAAPGTKLNLFRSTIAADRLTHAAEGIGLEPAGSVLLAGADGQPQAFLAFRPAKGDDREGDDRLVLALRYDGNGTQLLAASATAGLVRDLALEAVNRAVRESAAEQQPPYVSVKATPLADQDFRFAQQRQTTRETQAIVVAGAWDAGGLQLAVESEGHGPNGEADHPDLQPLLRRLGWQDLPVARQNRQRPLPPGPPPAAQQANRRRDQQRQRERGR